MRICAYVQDAYAKPAYKHECLNARMFVGLRVIIDSLQRAGHTVEWAGRATVHHYDVVLISITADCDWWSFVKERQTWQPGNYKVIVGGAGVLHVVPFLRWADYFVLGRGEKTVPDLVKYIQGESVELDGSVIESETFSPDRTYMIKQTDEPYPYELQLEGKSDGFKEQTIGCNHKCLFCAYTWQRKHVSPLEHFAFDTLGDKEGALLDMDFSEVDFSHLRTTAIDGMSERLRKMINKPITKDRLRDFLVAMKESGTAPHQVKLFNIVGYPSENEDDWFEFIDTLKEADAGAAHEKQWPIVLHSTPFRPMPATPLACAPMSKRNYRGSIGRTLGPGLKGNLIFQGSNFWAVESMGTESLPTVMLSAIAHRGNEADSENIGKLCATKKFWTSSTATKEKTLEHYFDMDKLFAEYTPETLPSRYLRTYLPVENAWGKRPWAKANG